MGVCVCVCVCENITPTHLRTTIGVYLLPNPHSLSLLPSLPPPSLSPPLSLPI